MQASSEVQVKGTPVRSFLAFIDGELTADQRDAVFSRVPGAYAKRLKDKQVLATEFVPVSVLNQITAEAARVKGEAVESFGRRAGRFAAREAVNTVMRFLVRVLTPEALISKGASVWRTVYDRGELKAVREEGNRSRVTLLDFPTEAAGCARITGWIEEMTAMTKVRDIAIKHPRCFAKGAPACEWEITWK